jgi:hypothetical protein
MEVGRIYGALKLKKEGTNAKLLLPIDRHSHVTDTVPMPYLRTPTKFHDVCVKRTLRSDARRRS